MINIGHSTIYGLTGENSSLRGPIGATGQTGADQTITGPTGPTGIDSNYVKEVLINKTTGEVTLVFADDTLNYNAGIIKGSTGIYAGITAVSVGNNIPILKGVCGGVTLEFYNFSPDGLIGITVDTDGNLKFSVNANSIAGSVNANIEPNKIVYAAQKNQINSTYLDVIHKVQSAIQSGNTAYGYVNFGLTGGRSVVGDVQETLLTVGPIERGNKVVTVEPFYNSGTSGITLDLSFSSVYKIVTPIGIKAFTTDDAPIPDGQIYSVTLIVEGDDVWNFPENVIFNDDSKAIFYPGTNILHLWKSNLATDTNWRAHFSARGFGVNSVSNPGVVGSCCYLDADGTKNCKEYVTEDYCIQQPNSTFSALVPCNLNPCITGSPSTYDGICCSEGRCISDIDPNLCSTIGGYFIDGITCGDVGVFPDNDADNLTGLCYNKCKAPTVCCKDGNCLGNLTKPHCEEILGGKIVEGENCSSVNCCDLISARGACCIPQTDGSYNCEYADTPYECKTTKGGYYMGINSACSSNICCNVPIDTCFECTQNSNTCTCNPVDIYTGTCQSNGLLDDCSTCQVKKCHKCDCSTSECVEIEVCTICPEGYVQGPCTASSCVNPPTKTCYAPCGNSTDCRSQTVTLGSDYDCRTCQQLALEGVVGEEYVNDDCTDCPCSQFEKKCYRECDPDTEECDEHIVILGDDEIVNCTSTCAQLEAAGYVPSGYVNDRCSCNSYVACFWCYPNITGPNDFIPYEGVTLGPGGQPQDIAWRKRVIERGYAPYRAMHIVPERIYLKLEGGNQGVTYSWRFNNFTQYNMGPMENSESAGLAYQRGKGYHYIERGDCLAEDQSLVASSNYITPMGNPFDDCGEFYCTYLNSYVYTPNDSAENRDKCLDRFGYDDVLPTIKEKCKLCDNVFEQFYLEDPRGQTPQVPGGPRPPLPVTKIEKYQELIAQGIHAPFPPIWGRLSMWNIAQVCDITNLDSNLDSYGAIKEATNNLALLDPLLSWDMAMTFAGKQNLDTSPVKAPKGYLWWYYYTKQAADGITYNPYNDSSVVKYSTNMTYALNYQTGTNGNRCFNCSNGDRWPGQKSERCTCGPDDTEGMCGDPSGSSDGDSGPPAVPGAEPSTAYLDHIPWDPYRMGGHSVYCASRGHNPLNKFKLNPGSYPYSGGGPDQCDTYSFDKQEGWTHYSKPLKPEYGDKIGSVSDPTGQFNWTDNAELHYRRIQGEDTVLRCPDDPSYSGPKRIVPTDTQPRGILGRNFRYNLKEFNTGTVFYNPDKTTPTMFNGGFDGPQHNPPIFKWQLWETSGDPCYDRDLPGQTVNCGACCVPDYSDPFNPVCCSPCEQSTSKYCVNDIIENRIICLSAPSPCGNFCGCGANCPGLLCEVVCCEEPPGPCLATDNCSGPHCGSGSQGGGQLNIATGQNTGSKTVEIAPGVCVNMLCPECNLYESC